MKYECNVVYKEIDGTTVSREGEEGQGWGFGEQLVWVGIGGRKSKEEDRYWFIFLLILGPVR